DSERREPNSPDDIARLAPLRTPVAISIVALLVQIFLGGLVRHSMAGLACITFPLCFGNVWPPESSSEQIHMLHRFGATFVALLVIPTAIALLRRARGGARHLRAAALLALGLLVAQATLGVLSVTSLLFLPIITAHLAVGALLLATLVCTWTWLPARHGASEQKASPVPLKGEQGVPA